MSQRDLLRLLETMGRTDVNGISFANNVLAPEKALDLPFGSLPKRDPVDPLDDGFVGSTESLDETSYDSPWIGAPDKFTLAQVEFTSENDSDAEVKIAIPHDEYRDFVADYLQQHLPRVPYGRSCNGICREIADCIVASAYACGRHNRGYDHMLQFRLLADRYFQNIRITRWRGIYYINGVKVMTPERAYCNGTKGKKVTEFTRRQSDKATKQVINKFPPSKQASQGDKTKIPVNQMANARLAGFIPSNNFKTKIPDSFAHALFRALIRKDFVSNYEFLPDECYSGLFGGMPVLKRDLWSPSGDRNCLLKCFMFVLKDKLGVSILKALSIDPSKFDEEALMYLYEKSLTSGKAKDIIMASRLFEDYNKGKETFVDEWIAFAIRELQTRKIVIGDETSFTVLCSCLGIRGLALYPRGKQYYVGARDCHVDIAVLFYKGHCYAHKFPALFIIEGENYVFTSAVYDFSVAPLFNFMNEWEILHHYYSHNKPKATWNFVKMIEDQCPPPTEAASKHVTFMLEHSANVQNELDQCMANIKDSLVDPQLRVELETRQVPSLMSDATQPTPAVSNVIEKGKSFADVLARPGSLLSRCAKTMAPQLPFNEPVVLPPILPATPAAEVVLQPNKDVITQVAELSAVTGAAPTKVVQELFLPPASPVVEEDDNINVVIARSQIANGRIFLDEQPRRRQSAPNFADDFQQALEISELIETKGWSCSAEVVTTVPAQESFPNEFYLVKAGSASTIILPEVAEITADLVSAVEGEVSPTCLTAKQLVEDTFNSLDYDMFDTPPPLEFATPCGSTTSFTTASETTVIPIEHCRTQYYRRNDSTNVDQLLIEQSNVVRAFQGMAAQNCDLTDDEVTAISAACVEHCAKTMVVPEHRKQVDQDEYVDEAEQTFRSARQRYVERRSKQPCPPTRDFPDPVAPSPFVPLQPAPTPAVYAEPKKVEAVLPELEAKSAEVDEMIEGEIGVGLLGLLQTTLNTAMKSFGLSSNLRYGLILSGPILAILTGIFNIVNLCMHKVANWLSILANLGSIAANIVSMTFIFKQVSSIESVTKAFIEQAKAVISDYVIARHIKPARPSSAPASYSNPAAGDEAFGLREWLIPGVKLISLAACTIMTLVGVEGVLPKINTMMTTATSVTTLSNEVLACVGQYCGIDVDGSLAFNNIVDGHKNEADKWLQVPSQDLVGQKLTNAQNWIKQTRLFVNSAPKKYQGTGLTELSRVLGIIETRVANVIADMTNRVLKADPCVVYLYSQQGGLGKTHLMNTIPKVLHSRLRGFNSESLVMMCGSKHFNSYRSEHTVIIDEVGASMAKGGDTGEITSMLNALCSVSGQPLPGAALEDKNQIYKPKLVLLGSNTAHRNIATTLTPAAMAAQYTRLLEFEVIDSNYDPRRGRHDQPHRRADFSHLTFRMHNYRNQTHRDYTVEQFFNVIHKDIVDKDRAFRIAKDQLKAISDPAPETAYELADESYSADDTKHCYWVAGRQNTGKSRDTVKTFIKVAYTMGYQVVQVQSISEFDTIEVPKLPTLYILDDIYQKTPECQRLFMEFYNKMNSNAKFLVVSNYGPTYSAMLHPVLYSRSYFERDVVNCEGFPRRFGWCSFPVREAKLYVKTQGCCFDIDTRETLTEASILRTWSEFDGRKHYPKVLNKLPDIIPFSPENSDLWVDLSPTDSPLHQFSSVIKSSSGRLLRLVGTKSLSSFSGGDLRTRVLTLLGFATRDVDDLKVFVSCGDEVCYINGLDMYFGSDLGRAIKIKTNDSTGIVYSCMDGLSIPCTQQIVNHVYLEEIPSEQESILAYHYLLHERKIHSRLWQETLKAYPISGTTFVKRQINNSKRLLVKTLKFLKDYWYVPLFVFVSITILAILCRKMPDAEPKSKTLDDANKKLAKMKDLPFSCKYCDAGMPESCPALNLQLITEDDDSFAGRNVNKNKPHRYHHQVTWNRRTMMCSDSFFEEKDNKDALSKAKHVLRSETNFGLEEYTSPKRMRMRDGMDKTDYIIGYKYIDGKVHIIAEVAGYDMSFAMDVVGFPKNTVQLKSTTMTLYGVAMDNRILRVGRHIFDGDYQQILQIVGTEYYAEPVFHVPAVDITYCRVVNKQGNVVQLPGVARIVDNILSVAAMKKITRACIVDPANPDNRYSTDIEYKDSMVPAIASRGQTFTGGGGIVSYGCMDECFIRKGDCGAQVIGYINGKQYFLGQLAVHRGGLKQFVFSMVTVEEWNDFCKFTITNDCAFSAPSLENVPYTSCQYFLPPQVRELRQAVMCDKALDLMRPVTDDCEYVATGPGMTTMFEMPTNHCSIDSNQPKRVIAKKAFFNVFGELKKPALSCKEIETDFAHEIPADKRGNKRAYNIRLHKSNGNIIRPLDATMFHVRRKLASDLGTFWRTKIGFAQLSPLTEQDAIWGNGFTDKLKRDTSVGALFQTMFRGVYAKGDLFGENRGEYIGIPGVQTHIMIQDQWNLAKEGIEYMFPSSLSMKSECLAIEKVWKKRIIHVVDPVTVVNQRRLFMPAQQAFNKLGNYSPFILALDPLVEFNDLAQRMLAHPNRTALDVSSFDLTVPLDLMECAAEFLISFYNAGPIMTTLIYTIVRTIANSPFLAGKAVVACQGGVNSGISNTSFFDAIIMKLISFYTYCAIYDYEDVHPEDYESEVDTASCGDDTIMCWNNRCNADGFSGDAVAAYAKEHYGMEFTPMQKVEGQKLVQLPLDEMSFCSRTFTRIPGYENIWSGRLKPEAMSSALCYTSFESDDQLTDHLNAIVREFALWPDDYYERFQQALTQTDIKGILVVRLEVVRQVLRDQIVAAKPKARYNRLDCIQAKSEAGTFSLEELLGTVKPLDYRIPKAMATAQVDVRTLSDKALAKRLFQIVVNKDYMTLATCDEIVELAGRTLSPEEARMVDVGLNGKSFLMPAENSCKFWFDFSVYFTGNFVPEWVQTLLQYNLASTTTKAEAKLVKRIRLARAFYDVKENGDNSPLKNYFLGIDDAYSKKLNKMRPLSAPHVVYGNTEAAQCAHLNASGDLVPNRHIHICIQCAKPFTHVHTTAGYVKLPGSLGHYCTRCIATKSKEPVVIQEQGNGPEFDSQPDLATPHDSAFSALLQKKTIYCFDEAFSDRNSERTAEPPLAGETGGQMAVAQGGVAGVSPSLFPGVALADNSQSMVPTSGQQTSRPLFAVQGGVGTEMMHQTAYSENILTLASKKIFSKIVPIVTGTAEGTVLWTVDIDPWSEQILNKYALAWAKLHSRFRGSLLCHVSLYTAASVIGTIKVAYINALLKGMPRDQASLDSLPTWLELSMNTSGDNVFPLVPTVRESAVTGIYRGENSYFGTLIIYTGTKIQNSFPQEVDLQLKFSFSLAADAFYDLPADLYSPAEVNYNMEVPDFGLSLPGAVLIVDGQRYGSVAYSGVAPTNYGGMVGGTLNVGGYMNGVAWPGFAYPKQDATRTVLHVAGWQPFWTDVDDSIPQSIYTALDVIKRIPIVITNDAVGQPEASEVYVARHRQLLTNNAIEYVNITGKYAGSRISVYEPYLTKLTFGYYCNTNVAKMRIIPGSRIVYDENGFQTSNYRMVAVFEDGMSWEAGEGETRRIDAHTPFDAAGIVNTIRLYGVALCTKDVTTADFIPTDYYRINILAPNSIIPAVSSGLTGPTTVEMASFVESMQTTVKDLDDRNAASIITTLNDRSGKFVCQILRNRYGAFIARRNLTPYMRLIANFPTLTQVHQYDTREWPSLQAADSNLFKTRTVGNTYEGITAGTYVREVTTDAVRALCETSVSEKFMGYATVTTQFGDYDEAFSARLDEINAQGNIDYDIQNMLSDRRLEGVKLTNYSNFETAQANNAARIKQNIDTQSTNLGIAREGFQNKLEQTRLETESRTRLQQERLAADASIAKRENISRFQTASLAANATTKAAQIASDAALTAEKFTAKTNAASLIGAAAVSPILGFATQAIDQQNWKERNQIQFSQDVSKLRMMTNARALTSTGNTVAEGQY